MLNPKFVHIYSKLIQAQSDSFYIKEYENAQQQALRFFNRHFENGPEVWQAGLNYWYNKKSYNNPDNPRDAAATAQFILKDIKEYKTKAPYMIEKGKPLSRGDKQRQTLNGYGWNTTNAGKPFTKDDIISMATKIHDNQSAQQWLEDKKRPPGALDFLINKSLAGVWEQDKETVMRDKGSTAQYVEWLKEAGLSRLLDSGHFTHLWGEIGPYITNLMKEAPYSV